MFKKTMTYVDYDGLERTEDLYFNLTHAELLDMQMGIDGGMKKLLEKIVAEKDSKRIYEIFKDIVNKSYGVKSPDGKRFIKSQEILDEFMQSPAYSDLIVEFVQDANAAAEFVNAIIPNQPAKVPATTPGV